MQPGEGGTDEHQPAIPAVEEGTGEGAKQRVGQEENGEGARDGPRTGRPLGVEEQCARQAALEQPVAEEAHGPQFQQSAELGQRAHQTPDGSARVRLDHVDPMSVGVFGAPMGDHVTLQRFANPTGAAAPDRRRLRTLVT